MPYLGDDEQYVKDCWRGKTLHETYSESGLLDLTAMQYENYREEQMYGVFVNGQLAYQNEAKEPCTKIYKAFTRN